MKNAFIVFFTSVLLPLASLASGKFSQIPFPQQRTEWCTGQKLRDIKLGNQRPDKNDNTSVYLCVYVNESGSVDVITLREGKRYDWTGNYVAESEDGIGAFQTKQILLKVQKLMDGKVAYMYKLQPIVENGRLVLSYRAGLGLIYDPQTKSFADYATLLVDEEDYYEFDPDHGYYSSADPTDQKTNREFNGENFQTIRLMREFEYKKN